MSLSLLRYLFQRVVIFFFRRLVKLQYNTTASPDDITYIPSRDPHRSIKTHVYRPSKQDTTRTPSPIPSPTPVLINFVGCGYVLPLHGMSDSFCREISHRTNHIVLDVEYRLAPENPFPAQLHDAEDVIRWVKTQPSIYDVSHISLSGFSSGGNLALATASSFPNDALQLHSVIAFYPPTELYLDPKTLVPPEIGGSPASPFVYDLFFGCWLPDRLDRRDPRISPGLANAESFPEKVMIITTGYDPLAAEGERLAGKLRADPKRQMAWERIGGCDHGWDVIAKPGYPGWEMRCKVYDMVVDMLQS
ncbi:hypothetical protein N7478_009319 [Penicillium angulare]|uniref:uncharacterized protein n=1 Tax=Penicillium angulare TaxID=116970 RepID=UPI002541000E|nr:uncharacterized protein N7478_009319 [Penicillium angulare]KAJ5266511.1 hypothetical protein N7478_009319 [Penicillium angulare]